MTTVVIWKVFSQQNRQFDLCIRGRQLYERWIALSYGYWFLQAFWQNPHQTAFTSCGLVLILVSFKLSFNTTFGHFEMIEKSLSNE